VFSLRYFAARTPSHVSSEVCIFTYPLTAARENIDTHAASTDRRVTLYVNGQENMFERKVVIKKQRGGLNIKKTKPSIFSFPT
jgi:hypothetical protein